MDINIKELLQKSREQKLNIIDIRNSYKYNNGHISNATNIPSEYLMIEPEKYLNKNETYYIYCQSGHTSKNIANILNKKGYNIVNVIGGYNNY